MASFADVQEVNFSGGLIPEGRCEMFSVIFDKDKRTTDKGNGYYNVTLECLTGNYAGSKLYDNIAVDGPDGYFLQRGKTAIMYMLETTREAHKDATKRSYELNSPQELNSVGRIVAKVGIKPHVTKDGNNILVNEVKAYGTPRESSSNFKFFMAWAKNEQLWETDEKPILPNGAATKSAPPRDLDDEIPF